MWLCPWLVSLTLSACLVQHTRSSTSIRLIWFVQERCKVIAVSAMS